jgi:tRNA_anti-like
MPADRRDRDFEFDDDRPARRRPRDDYDDRDDYADGPGGGPHRGPVGKGVNICGVIALVLGILGLVIALIPCFGIIGIPLAAIGLLLGIIGIFTSGKTTGRGMPIAGTCVSAAGLLIGVLWLALAANFFKKVDEKIAAEQAAIERESNLAQEEARKAAEKREREEKEFREGKAVTVTAQKLYEDYRANALSADSKYKTKVLEISGAVDRVDKDRFGRAAVELKTGDDGIVRCEFPRDAVAQLEKLKPEQKVTIRGRCTGRGKKDEIKLEDCLLVTR